MNTNPCHLLGLPDELLERILFFTLYEGPEFRVTHLEYEDITKRGTPFARRHRWFAMDCLAINRRINRIGLPLLWRFVIVRSMYCLCSIRRQAIQGGPFFGANIIGPKTQRLQLRIHGEFDPLLLADTFLAMPNIRVLIVNNVTDERQPHSTMKLTDLAGTVSHLSKLRRLQFQSPQPTLTDIHNILAQHTNLKTLRCDSILQPNVPVLPVAGSWTFRNHKLSVLSLGLTSAEGRDEFAAQGVQSLIDHLTAMPPTSLGKLTRVHLLQYAPSVGEFLRQHGTRLQLLLYSTPSLPTNSSDHENFLSMCPNLRVLIWVATERGGDSPIHTLPGAHNRLKVITIVYPDTWSTTSEGQGRLQHFIDILENGYFPNLKTVKLQPGGGDGGSLESQTWFRARRRRLSRSNTGLQLHIDAGV